MLLRSSSAPILGSLLHNADSSTTHSHHHYPHPHPFTCHLSDSTDHPPPSSVRRSRSDGNLHALLSDHPNDHHHHHPPPRSSFRLPTPILKTVPSFSVYHTTDLKEEVEEDINNMDEIATTMERGFSFEKQNVRMATSPLFLARGLGIDRIGSGLMNAGGGGDGGDGGGGDGCYGGGDQSDIEGYYKRMIDENPSNALFLRNYAQFLYQKKGDIQRAEEYYSRAILLDPGDGEMMSQYAKLVWELHGDEERASSYFERAVQAAPQDSHILASYAGFLWEVEDEDCMGNLGDEKLQDHVGSFQHGILASAT